MVLTVDDIVEIMSLGYGLRYFAEFRGGFVRLKNINGHCVFLDTRTNKCVIYEFRPRGCRLYPIVYDPIRDTVTVDRYCPRAHDVEREYIEKYRDVLLQELRRIYDGALKAVDLYARLL